MLDIKFVRENIEKGHSMGIEQGQKLERITLIKKMTNGVFIQSLSSYLSLIL